MNDSSLKHRITDDMNEALRSGNKRRLGTLRLLVAAIKQREIDERIMLDDTQTMAVIDKMIKQRRDSIKHYSAAGRKELEEQEAFEIEILQAYLPTPLTDAEVEDLIKAAITETGASSMKDMGSVMGIIKSKAQGRVDMGQLSAKIRALLNP